MFGLYPWAADATVVEFLSHPLSWLVLHSAQSRRRFRRIRTAKHYVMHVLLILYHGHGGLKDGET